MLKNWTVTSKSLSVDESKILSSLESVIAAQGDEVSRDTESYVRRIILAEKTLYTKCYLRLQPGFAARLMPSRAKTEWKNLLLFKRLGINTPELLAYGENRCLTSYSGGALVTAGVEGAVDLKELSITRPDLFVDRQWLQRVFDQIIDFTRRLHHHRFAHNDLNWRNILVIPESGEVFFFDCPLGRRWLSPLLAFRSLKDLSHLDKVAPNRLSKAQRLRFYMQYAEISKLDETHKKRLRWIVERTEQSLQKKRNADALRASSQAKN